MTDFDYTNRVKIQGKDRIGEISYSGSDVIAFAYMPILSDPTVSQDEITKKIKRSRLLGTLQTISISSTRSVTPVRVFGSSYPIGYARGGRTTAGTLVFATLEEDAFSRIYRPDALREGYIDGSSSLFVDQLPPFNVVLVASNEMGGVSRQIVHNVTLLNYGTTYSVDDVYTESTYSFIAEDVTPLMSDNRISGEKYHPFKKSLSDIMSEIYGKHDGSASEAYIDTINNLLEDVINPGLESLRGLRQAFVAGQTTSHSVLPHKRYLFTKLKGR